MILCYFIFFSRLEVEAINLWLERNHSRFLYYLDIFCYQKHTHRERDTFIDDNNDKIFVQIIIFACFVWHVYSSKYTFSVSAHTERHTESERWKETHESTHMQRTLATKLSGKCSGGIFLIEQRDKDYNSIAIYTNWIRKMPRTKQRLKWRRSRGKKKNISTHQ